MTSVDYIYNHRLVQDIAKNMKVSDEYFDDLCQEVYFILLTGYTDEKLQEAIDNNQINYIITSIMKKQWFSATSPFYTTYKKPQKNKTDIDELDGKY